MYKKNGRTAYKSNRRPSFKKPGGYKNFNNRNRGNVSQQYNKYLKLAKEASRSSDRIQSEYYYQFTDHYYRIMIELGINIEENSQSDEIVKSSSEDQSNDNDYFQRVKIRKIISNFKMSGLEKDKLFLTLKNLKSSNKAITFYTEQNKKINSYLDKKSEKLFLNKIFFNQPYEVVFRSFSDSLKKIGGRYFSARGKKIDNILQKIEKNAFKKETLAGCIVKKVNQTVIITKEY